MEDIAHAVVAVAAIILKMCLHWQRWLGVSTALGRIDGKASWNTLKDLSHNTLLTYREHTVGHIFLCFGYIYSYIVQEDVSYSAKYEISSYTFDLNIGR